MGPIVGMLLGGAGGGGLMSGLLGGAAGGGGLLGGLMQNGGLGGLISNLFGGGQQAGGDSQTNELLSDIKDMLGQLIEQKGGEGGSPTHGGAPGGCDKAPSGGHDCGSTPPSDGGDADGGHGCDGADKPSCGGAEEQPACGDSDDHGCGDAEDTHDCGGTDDAGWDGKDKSPSLDRERGAARLLDQASNTDDPEQKRELIDMALEMLGEGPKGDGLFGDIKKKMDGNSYDNDVVKQAHNMLEQIDDGNLSGCNEAKALDSVIDMLMGEGGVDGKPAANDMNGDGRYDLMDKWGLSDAA